MLNVDYSSNNYINYPSMWMTQLTNRSLTSGNYSLVNSIDVTGTAVSTLSPYTPKYSDTNAYTIEYPTTGVTDIGINVAGSIYPRVVWGNTVEYTVTVSHTVDGGGTYLAYPETLSYAYQSTDNVIKILNARSRYKQNLYPVIKTRVTTQNKITEAEKLAQDLLRDMITETEFRNYLKYGFLLIPVGEKTYQIFKDRSHTKVWVKGKVVEELCIRVKSEIQCPPTDGVITKKILLESSEELFRSKCNVYNMLMAA